MAEYVFDKESGEYININGDDDDDEEVTSTMRGDDDDVKVGAAGTQEVSYDITNN